MRSSISAPDLRLAFARATQRRASDGALVAGSDGGAHMSSRRAFHTHLTLDL
jgi:hypothetical protein